MTLGADYFRELYAAAEDPWRLAERWYEKRKYALTLAALPRERYRRALEAGCSVGVLTALLAKRCDELVAIDGAAAAVRTASARTARHPHVTVAQGQLPGDWPAGRFDLIVLSEIGYYFDAADFDVVITAAAASLSAGGTLVAAHWRHPVKDYPRTGDEVHDSLRSRASALGLVRTVLHTEDDFLLEVFLRTPPMALSVAQQTGLV